MAIKVVLQSLTSRVPASDITPKAPDWFLRVELGDSVLYESSKRPMSQLCSDVDLGEMHFDVPCNPAHTSTLALLTQYPLLVSFLQLLPKDKKQKEERTKLLGQAAVDLLPYVQEQAPSDPLYLPLHPPDDLAPSSEVSGIVAEISTSSLNLSDTRLVDSNVLTMRLRSLHSLPDVLATPQSSSSSSSSSPFSFTASMPLPPVKPTPPITTITIPHGTLKPPPSDHAPRSTHWRWPGTITSEIASRVCPIEPRPLEEEVGVWHGKTDVTFRQTAECGQPRVDWNVQHRTWLTADDTRALLKTLSQSPLWPLEIGRFMAPPPTAGKGSKGKSEPQEPLLSYHGVSYLDLSPLLYPGATSIYGVFSVHPYSRAEVLHKTNHAVPSHLAPPPASGGVGTEDPVSALKKLSVKTTNSLSKMSDGGQEEGAEPAKRDADAYQEAKTYVFLEMELHRPLIAKRPASMLAERVQEYVPVRSALPRHVGGAEWAVNEFQQQAASIASQLVAEFRTLLEEGELDAGGGARKKGEKEREEPGKAERKPGVRDGSSAPKTEAEERRHKFIFHLNSTGKYHAIKEMLKRSVVKVVREKYLNQVCLDDQAQFQKFLSELYVFLVDQMHIGLKKVFSIQGSAPSVASPVTPDLLKHFAFEAESLGNYELAERYYKERVSKQDHNAEMWYDYAVFCLLVSKPDRCEQCLKEAVALDGTMIPALVLYGMVCCLDEQYEVAADVFEMATTCDPTNIVAWTMRGLYYEHACNKLMQGMCFHEAQKLNAGSNSKTFLKLSMTTSKLGGRTLSGHAPVAHRSSKQNMGSKPQQQQQLQQQAATASTTLSHPSTGSIKTGGMVKEGVGSGGGASGLLGDEEVQRDTPTDMVGSQGVLPQNQGPQAGQEEGQGETELTGTLHNDSGTRVDSARSTKLSNQGLKSMVSDTVFPPPQDKGRDTMATPLMDEEEEGGDGNSIFLQTASYLLDVHALKFAEMALAHELASASGAGERGEAKISPSYLVAEARLHMHRELYQEAKACLKKALKVDILNSNAWALLGHTHYLLEEWPEAQDAYERTLGYMTPPTHLHILYTRLADIYLRYEKYEDAQHTFLRACKHSPTSRTWFGVGVACYRLGDLEQAEDALSEANILNNQDPEVWAYLTMVCLKTQRPVEAEQSLKFAIKVGLKDEDLLDQIRDLHKIHMPHSDLVHIPTTPSQPVSLNMET